MSERRTIESEPIPTCEFRWRFDMDISSDKFLEQKYEIHISEEKPPFFTPTFKEIRCIWRRVPTVMGNPDDY